MGPPHAQGLQEARCAADRSTWPSCNRGMAQVTSGAVDHFDKEAVRDRERERLRDVHRYGYCSAWELMVADPRNHPRRNGEQDRRSRSVPRAGRGVYLVPTLWTEGGAAPISSLPGRVVRWTCRSDPRLVASVPS